MTASVSIHNKYFLHHQPFLHTHTKICFLRKCTSKASQEKDDISSTREEQNDFSKQTLSKKET